MRESFGSTPSSARFSRSFSGLLTRRAILIPLVEQTFEDVEASL